MTVVTPDLYRATIQKYVGCNYGFCDRCGGGCHPCQYDCSGLQCKGTNETGLTRNVCTSSFVIAQQCYDLGLLVAWEDVNEYDGLWWIRGDDLGRRDNGSKANGASGHIVYRVRHRNPATGAVTFYTIEAMGRLFGVVNGTTNGRVWDAAYKIPGMSNAPPAPTSTIKEQDMVILPGIGTPPGRRRVADLDPSGLFIRVWNGGRIADLDGHRDGDDPDMRRCYPRNLDGTHAPTAALPLDGLELTPNREVLVAKRKDGSTYDIAVFE